MSDVRWSLNEIERLRKICDDAWKVIQDERKRVAGLGVVALLGFNPVDMFGVDWDSDWRVAGALMEKMTASEFLRIVAMFGARSKMDANAIIQACVEALEAK